MTNHHSMTATIDDGGAIRFEAKCDADEGAPCRSFCNECEEYLREDHDQHAIVDQGRCLAIEWLTIDPDQIPELYNGETAEIRSDFIDLEWQGEGYLWAYADPESGGIGEGSDA